MPRSLFVEDPDEAAASVASGVCDCTAGVLALVQLDGNSPVRATITAVKNFVSHIATAKKATVRPWRPDSSTMEENLPDQPVNPFCCVSKVGTGVRIWMLDADAPGG